MSPDTSIYSPQVNSKVTHEEYWLYSVLIRDRFARSAREQFVIRRELSASSLLVKGKQGSIKARIEEWQLNLEGLKEETAQAFLNRNREPAVLEENLDLPLPYALLSEEESGEIWDWRDQTTFAGEARDGWKV